MKKLIAIAIAATALAGCGTTKSRSFDAKGMYLSETGQLAVGYIHVDAIPEGTDSAVIHYTEDTALLSPSTKTHDIDIILTGTNSVGSASSIVKSICQAFVSVAPKIAEANANTPKGATALDAAQANAAKNAEVKELKAAAKAVDAKGSTSQPPQDSQSSPDCADGSCEMT